MTSKKDRKRLKAPDAFQVKMMSYVDEMLKHRTFLYGLGLGTVLIVIVVLGGRYYKSEQLRQRISTLFEIDQMYMLEEESVQKERIKIEEKILDLNKKIDSKEEELKKATASSNKKDETKNNKDLQQSKETDKDIAAYNAEIEKQEKLIESLKADHAASITKYESFYKENKDSAEGVRAAIMVINQYLEDKKFLEASLLTTDILSHLKDKPFLHIQLLNLKISILEELSKFDEALVELDKVIKLDSDDKNKASYLLTKGRLNMHTGKKDEAATIFKDIMLQYENSQEANKARSFHALMYQYQ